MQAVGDALRQFAKERDPQLLVSKRQQNRMDSVELIRQADGSRPPLAFNSRPFVLCGLPVRRPPVGLTKYTRTNGRFKLEVVAHPHFGLPFGQDRLIPIWVATLAVRQKSATVMFRSAAQILDEFDLPKDGPHYRRLVAGFQRVFASTIFFGTNAMGGGERVWECRRFHFFDRMRIWCSRGQADQVDESTPDCNVITLSESFWQEIQAHPIPVDGRIVRALTSNLGCLDLYMWLSWRCFHAKRQDHVPLFGPGGLASQLGVMEYSRQRNFRKRLRAWLELLKLYWPDCPAGILPSGSVLQVAPCRNTSSGEGSGAAPHVRREAP